jgi:hypothetical protein
MVDVETTVLLLGRRDPDSNPSGFCEVRVFLLARRLPSMGAGGNAMRILICTLGLTAAASLAAANPLTTAQTHGNPHTTSSRPTTSSTSGKTTTSTSGSTTSTSGGTTTTTTTTRLNPIAAKITAHPRLDSKVTAMLPTGMTLNQASMGFKNQGQFIAALHVSQNLGIPFKDLRTQMVNNNLSLGQAIQKVKGTTDTTAVTIAGKQADDDLKTTTTTSTTASTPKKKNGKCRERSSRRAC